eukprot:TRINITY_DN4264_c0_g1_i1.p1 TRINITY_DN4264_c0_g1~~TRINITY_DN4264_c0_g1_i1.p1  ORF type:complete len:481 (-),score=157.29 TRINITY_DN4264_c0_g1_i1:66-1508(-)
MPRVKKSWVNKKNTVTYELSVRSDKGGEAVSVLTPIKAYGHQVVPDQLYDELNQRFASGEEGSEYESEEEGQYSDAEDSDDDPLRRYTKSIGSVPGSVFITPEGTVLNAQSVPSWDRDAVPEEEEKRRPKAAAIVEEPEDIDADILEALEGADEEGAFEAFEDDFVQEIMKGDGENGEFEEIGGGYGLDDLEGDDEPVKKPLKEFTTSKIHQFMTDSEEDYDTDEEIMESKPRTLKLVDEMFDAALDRFDEDDTLDMEPESPAISGTSNASAFTEVFDEFLHNNSKVSVYELDEIFGKDASNFLIPGKKFQRDVLADAEPIQKEKILAGYRDEEDEESDDSTEDWKKSIAGGDTLTFRDKEGGWDVESIISTYSTTENHPSLIAMPRSDRIKLGSKGAPKMSPAVYEPKPVKKEVIIVERKKDETPEEKKARKNLVKEQRRKQREEKKGNRDAFKEEEVKQRHQNASNFTRGKKVVQYTL